MKKIVFFIIIGTILILAVLYYSFFNHEFMFSTKPTQLNVSTVSVPYKSQATKFHNVKITNSTDVKKLYNIIIKSPSEPNGTLNCRMGGPAYKLIFKNKSNHSFKAIVHDDGCGIANINLLNNRVILNSDFWNVLAKNLKVPVEKLR